MFKSVTAIVRPAGSHWVGDGLPVRTVFSHQTLGERISPFLLLDYAGPADFEPAAAPRGVGPHPHRGFETVTILYQGQLQHRDSAGNQGTISPGDVQWMTAGAGILHEEMHSDAFTRTGGTLEMVQLWVNLPAADKLAPPAYQTLERDRIPSIDLPDAAGTLRVIAGQCDAVVGPARTHTRINLWDVQFNPGKQVQLALPEGDTAGLFVLRGRVNVNETAASAVEMALMSTEGDTLTVSGLEPATLLLISGTPIREPVAAYGPFVMNTHTEIRQALSDYQAGKFGHME